MTDEERYQYFCSLRPKIESTGGIYEYIRGGYTYTISVSDDLESITETTLKTRYAPKSVTRAVTKFTQVYEKEILRFIIENAK